MNLKSLKKSLESLTSMELYQWHTLSPESLMKHLDSSPLGLTDAEVRRRLEKKGLNLMKAIKPTPTHQQFLFHFTNPLYIILTVVAIFKLAMNEIGEALAILFVILFNSFLGIFQEWKAEKALEALKSYLAPTAKVLREGDEVVVPASQLVPGDILLLSSGMKVPADARLLESIRLEVDESSLTGESLPSVKDSAALLQADAPLSERSNMVYQGTMVVQGRARACVIATGMSTEFGKIYDATASTSEQKPPIQQKMDRFGKQLTLFILGIIACIGLIGYMKGYSLYALFMTSLSLAVSAIPEGLPIAITVCLSYGLYQMAKRQAIIRKLSAVEVLGCTTVVCTDKTGTITQNSLTASVLMIDKKTSGQDLLLKQSPSDVQSLFKRCVYFASETRHAAVKSPLEHALFQLVEPISTPVDDQNWKIILPFESQTQRMIAQTTHNGIPYLWCKGSPEVVSKMCSHQLTSEGKEVPFEYTQFHQSIEAFSSEGFRTIALAYRQLTSPDSPESNFTMLGAIGFIDPPRDEAKEAIQACQQGGIRVYMITGDHPKTACAIAREVDFSGNTQEALLGPTIDTLSDASLLEELKKHTIIARATPLNKLRIVNLLQKQGHIVAMTGDGMNDAPPLKQANIGIAMGSGTEAAKEASSMVVMNDAFSTIVSALRYGRCIYKNIQHMILYLLSTSMGGLLTIAGSILVGLPLPLLPIQILWINVITDGSTIVPLAFEKEHGDGMKAPPRPMNEPLITKPMWRRAFTTSLLMSIGTLFLFSWGLYKEHFSLEKSQTIAFATLAFFQIMNAFNARSLSRSLFFQFKTLSPIRASDNPLFLWVVSISFLCQILVIQLPFLNGILHTTPLTLLEWLTIFLCSMTVVFIAEIDKWLKQTNQHQ